MDSKINLAILFRLLKKLTLLSAGIACLLTLSVSATESGNVSAVPDYGEDDCVSFKEGNSVNPLNFTFGYACVSKANCEVFEHGCIDDICHFPDYSKGTRTTLGPVPVMTLVGLSA